MRDERFKQEPGARKAKLEMRNEPAGRIGYKAIEKMSFRGGATKQTQIFLENYVPRRGSIYVETRIFPCFPRPVGAEHKKR